MSTPTVRPSQVWADNDPRAAGRTLRVDAIDGDKATCTILTNTDETQEYLDHPDAKPAWMAGAYGDRRGRQTRVSLRRFVPTSTGYRLIRDAPDPSAVGGATQSPSKESVDLQGAAVARAVLREDGESR